ncbi:RNA-binding domain-containing protein [Aspergillus uvarum CBS 121591]|uniref:RNA-binding domain-containing protein n=1 Tax=Aspergillus uvarum CBS 121591 TaxID=1448315 RepID=A0A319CIA5_9EURO|nr:RNA-binding domain-containing protein [Aspergillus uvarum CBS 121591]PYH84924.1 RNA-binding domain-containing protein [Aspergillus uvarum CBS 121591]
MARKMFIGGLNWETTDQSLKDYFSQFGEVQECTVMRDSATGRSRGFGFLTFRDPKTVNTVMVKEHYLDGKIIDPKRAIPRDEQEKTSKIFVGGVSQEANEHDFRDFFTQFGRVIDATLMIDKDTGRPRGFGFVTFDSEAAVEAALSRPLEILGKPIEVKKAQPRGNLRDEEDRRFRRGREGFRDGGAMGSDGSQPQAGAQGQGSMAGGLTPQMMAQYWQRMQQYFALMQQQMAVAAAQGQGMGGMGMGGMNPAMMQQMQQMKQMQQMQMGNNQAPQESLSPPSQSATPQTMAPNMMNPAMMQQMQQMQQMQNQGQASSSGSMAGQMGGGGNGMNMAAANANGNYSNHRGGPGYNAQEQIAFEQQKYEQQQARRAMENRAFSPYQQGGPTSWEGMYDEVPQPNIPTGPQAMTRAGSMGRGPTPQPQSAAPANAPTGPKNAGKPGANYRGGGRGGHRGFHPYSRG